VVLDGIQYGEVKPSSFVQVLAWLAPEPGDVFVDIGSGTGRAVLTAAALYSLGGAIGIEIQPELHTAATRAHAKLDWSAAATGQERVRFCLEDGLATEVTWPASASLIFCTTTCFTDEMLASFTRLASRLRPGARVAITTRGFKGAPFELMHSGLLPYAKGALTFHVYRRI
jgi:precorrin-6B methylase 2